MVTKINSIKAIGSKEDCPQGSDENVYRTYDIRQYNDKIVMFHSAYEKIFDHLRKNETKPWKRAKVKILYNGKEIVRLFKGSSSEGIKKGQIGLTYESLTMLGIDYKTFLKTKHIDITIETGSNLKFLWNHPDIYVRVSYKIGLMGIPLTILCTAISILF